MLADDHIDAIRRAIDRTHAPIEILGQGGRRSVFRLVRGKLYGYEITASGSVKHEVMRESDISQMMNRPDVTRPDPVELEKGEIRTKFRADHPDMTEERVEENVDLIYEARRTMLTLVKSGITPQVASQMVTNALKASDMDREELRRMTAQYETQAQEQPPRPVADPMSGEF